MTYVNDSATTAAGDFRVGRLSGYLDGFETLLRGQGYARATLRQKRDLLADFCAWVERHDVPPDALEEKLTRRFLREHRHRGAWRGDSRTVQQFIGYLRDIGSISLLPLEVDSSAEGELVVAFGGVPTLGAWSLGFDIDELSAGGSRFPG